MKRAFFRPKWQATGILVLFAALAGVAGTSHFLCVGYSDDVKYVKTQNGHMRRLDRASGEGRVVFLGSSTFQGLDISAITPIGLNLSIGGDTLSGLIKRSSEYRSLSTARAIVINIGLNDLLQNCALPEVRFSDLVARAPKNTPVVLVGVQELMTINGSASCGKNQLASLVVSLNARLTDACNELPLCQFIPNPVAFDMNQATRAALLEKDGIHLSPLGYSRLSGTIRQALSNVGMPPPVVTR